MDTWGEHYLKNLPVEVVTGRENRNEGHRIIESQNGLGWKGP